MREIRRAELLSIGSELTVGETRDTNAGELAGALTNAGVEVLRLTALPDDVETVRAAFEAALERADLVVSTGGLGPTPDDLTREAIVAAIGETPTLDPDLEAWLRGRFSRRGVQFSDTNLKQAWVSPSTTTIPNPNGSAPGWWVDRPDGRVIVALPGPPRELRPMWTEWVMPRLQACGLGQRTAMVVLRTTGIGESLIAERLGKLLVRGANPTVATYARSDAVDIRISAIPEGGRAAAAMVAVAEGEVLAKIGEHVWGRGAVTWPISIEAALAAHDWRLATVEIGTRGSLAALLGEGLGDRLVSATVIANDPSDHGGAYGPADGAGKRSGDTMFGLARDAAARSGAEVGVAVRIQTKRDNLSVSIAIVDPDGEQHERKVTFAAGPMGRTSAALLAAAVIQARLR